MYTSNKQGQQIYYEVFGLSSGKTIIFLNGLTQSTESWALITPQFKQQYRVILMDFIFQGKSDKNGDWKDFDAHAEDVLAVLDAVGALQPMVVGISYGSLVAQHFALKFSERLSALILMSTFAHKTPYYEAIELSWWRALEHGGYQLMLDIMLPSVLSEGYFENPLIPIQAMKKARQALNQSPEAIFKLMRATKERQDFREKLKKVKVPTLIIQGEKDLLFPVHMAEQVQQSIQGSRLTIVRHAGHTLNIERTDEVAALIRNFSDQIK